MYGLCTTIRSGFCTLALLGASLGAMLSLAGHAQAQEPGIRSLLMPGKLIAAHADEEDNCGACHESFSKQAQDRLCLDCHEPVAADIEAGAGFHGRQQLAGSCSQCHSDHLGRDADITSLQIDSFDHRQTDFPLGGAHRQVACSSCHESGNTWREASGQCVDCHREDEPHRGALGEACADCHSDSAWKESRFDHDTTDFPLLGRHRETTCAACHPNERYEATPTQCAACHSLNDTHRGQRGQDCELCHVVDEWSEIRFDHSRDTEFELLGAHRSLSCQGCHAPGADMQTVVGTACVDCHRSDDVHSGRNSTECADCHSNDRWQEASFDHNSDTKFPLRGEHATLACESCHFAGALDQTNPAACDSCHASDDPHGKMEGAACNQCHRETGWQKVSFDHGLTSFPLLGLHASLQCESCHLDKAYRETGGACIDCHSQDDIHAGSQGENCAQCHNPTEWSRWEFDHGAQTEFRLTGRHAALVCQDCHGTEASTATSTNCISCHRDDDRHSGRFGRDCGRCHNSDAFDQVEMLR